MWQHKGNYVIGKNHWKRCLHEKNSCDQSLVDVSIKTQTAFLLWQEPHYETKLFLKLPFVCNKPPVYLHSIFEISSGTRIFFNFKISSLKNWKTNLISKLIFAGCTGSRNQVQTQKKIKLVLNSIFFQVWNKLRNPKFENRVQRDRATVK